MTHYYKLACTMFGVVGIILIVYSLLSCVYSLIISRSIGIGAALVQLLPALFYLLIGILFFAPKKRLASLVVRGLDSD